MTHRYLTSTLTLKRIGSFVKTKCSFLTFLAWMFMISLIYNIKQGEQNQHCDYTCSSVCHQKISSHNTDQGPMAHPCVLRGLSVNNTISKCYWVWSRNLRKLTMNKHPCMYNGEEPYQCVLPRVGLNLSFITTSILGTSHINVTQWLHVLVSDTRRSAATILTKVRCHIHVFWGFKCHYFHIKVYGH